MCVCACVVLLANDVYMNIVKDYLQILYKTIVFVFAGFCCNCKCLYVCVSVYQQQG